MDPAVKKAMWTDDDEILLEYISHSALGLFRLSRIAASLLTAASPLTAAPSVTRRFNAVLRSFEVLVEGGGRRSRRLGDAAVGMEKMPQSGGTP